MPPAEKLSLADAMAKTGTTSPKQALAAMNQHRRGRKRFALLPIPPKSTFRSNEAQRRRKQHFKRFLNRLQSIPTPDGVRRGFTGQLMLEQPEIAAFVKDNPDIFESPLNMDAVLVIEAKETE